MRLLNASTTSNIALTSYQRSAMLSSLLTSLQTTSGSILPQNYLTQLTIDQINILYTLFIESPQDVLAAFSVLPTFGTLVKRAVALPSKNCCQFNRNSRKLFASYAISQITNNPVLTYGNLLAMGACFATVLPFDRYVEMLT